VVLGDDFPTGLLRDSKKLSSAQREKAMVAIYGKAMAWGIGWASPEEIDTINILRASLLAMERAFAYIPGQMVSEAIADGLYAPRLPIGCSALVKADDTVPAVMAASILAKTARDRMMERYSFIYPEYAYEKHKGYPTKLHCQRIALYGPSPIQRKTFRVPLSEAWDGPEPKGPTRG
jgi:ribonuclease HII